MNHVAAPLHQNRKASRQHLFQSAHTQNEDLPLYSGEGQTHHGAFVCIHGQSPQIITATIIITQDPHIFKIYFGLTLFSSLKNLALLKYLSVFHYKQLAKSTSQTTQKNLYFSYLKQKLHFPLKYRYSPSPAGCYTWHRCFLLCQHWSPAAKADRSQQKRVRTCI